MDAGTWGRWDDEEKITLQIGERRGWQCFSQSMRLSVSNDWIRYIRQELRPLWRIVVRSILCFLSLPRYPLRSSTPAHGRHVGKGLRPYRPAFGKRIYQVLSISIKVTLPLYVRLLSLYSASRSVSYSIISKSDSTGRFTVSYHVLSYNALLKNQKSGLDGRASLSAIG